MSEDVKIRFRPRENEVKNMREWMSNEPVNDPNDYATLLEMLESDVWLLSYDVQIALVAVGVLDDIRMADDVV